MRKRGRIYRVRISGTIRKKKKGSGKDIFRRTINYRAGGAVDRLGTRRSREQARYFRTGISMVVLESIRSAVKIKVGGTSAPLDKHSKEESGALNRSRK